MADIKSSMKSAVVKGMEFIGNAAASIASGTRSKVNEMNLVSRRSEIFADLSTKVYELWQKGTEFPPEIQTMLDELGRLDEELNMLRAQRVAESKIAEEQAAEEADRAETEQEPGNEQPSDADHPTENE